MSRVYLIQERDDFNLAPARAFGEVDILIPLVKRRDGRMVQMQVFYPSQIDEMRSSLAERLKDFNPAEDWVIPNGDPVIMGIVFWIIARKGGGIRMLKWDRFEQVYVPIEVRDDRSFVAAF